MSTGMIFLLAFAAFAFMGRSRHRVRRASGWSADEATRRELAHVREMVENLSTRFHSLEAERDFYRELTETRAGRVPSVSPASAVSLST